MSTISANYQVGQNLGPGKIVNPSQVTSQQLKDKTLVTVLVPNSLEKSDSVNLSTPSARAEKSGIDMDKVKNFIGRAALGASSGTLAGLAVASIAKSSPIGIVAGLTVGTLMASNPSPEGLIDAIGGTVVGTGLGAVAGAAFQSSKVGLAVGIATGLTMYAISGAMGRI